MTAHHDKHCCSVNATLANMRESLRRQSGRHHILAVCSELEDRQVSSSISNMTGITWRDRVMIASVAAGTRSKLQIQYLHVCQQVLAACIIIIIISLLSG